MDANDNFELELLQLLAKELPVAKEAINTTFNNNDYETLHNHLH